MCMYGIVSCAAIVQSNSCLFLLHYHRHLRADVGVGPPAAEVKDKDQAQEVTGKGHQLGQPEG